MGDAIDAGAYAVIFTSRRTDVDTDYEATFDDLLAAAEHREGFLGIDSARSDGLGITVSYWSSEAAIAAWKADADHLVAQRRGQADWYDHYDVRVCRIERAYGYRSDRP